jgi:hypothetical protein
MDGETRTFGLELRLEGKTLAGTLVSDHAGALAIQNVRLDDEVLTFAVPMVGTSEQVGFTARLSGAASLAGTIAGPLGAMSFTAERKEAQPDK